MSEYSTRSHIRQKTETYAGSQMDFQFPSPTLSNYHPDYSESNILDRAVESYSSMRSSRKASSSSFDTFQMLNTKTNKYKTNSSEPSPKSRLSSLSKQQASELINPVPNRFSHFIDNQSRPLPKISRASENGKKGSSRSSREISDSMQSQATIFSTRNVKRTVSPVSSLKRSPAIKYKQGWMTKLKAIAKKLFRMRLFRFIAKPKKALKRGGSIVRNSTITHNLSREGSTRRSPSLRRSPSTAVRRSSTKRILNGLGLIVDTKQGVQEVSAPKETRNFSNKLIRKQRDSPQNPHIAKQMDMENSKFRDNLDHNQTFGKINHIDNYVEQQKNKFINDENVKQTKLDLVPDDSLSKQYTFRTVSDPKYAKTGKAAQLDFSEYSETPASKLGYGHEASTSSNATDKQAFQALWSQYLKIVIARRIMMRSEINQLYSKQDDEIRSIVGKNSKSVLVTMIEPDTESEKSSVFSRNSIIKEEEDSAVDMFDAYYGESETEPEQSEQSEPSESSNSTEQSAPIPPPHQYHHTISYQVKHEHNLVVIPPPTPIVHPTAFEFENIITTPEETSIPRWKFNERSHLQSQEKPYTQSLPGAARGKVYGNKTRTMERSSASLNLASIIS